MRSRIWSLFSDARASHDWWLCAAAPVRKRKNDELDRIRGSLGGVLIQTVSGCTSTHVCYGLRVTIWRRTPVMQQCCTVVFVRLCTFSRLTNYPLCHYSFRQQFSQYKEYPEQISFNYNEQYVNYQELFAKSGGFVMVTATHVDDESKATLINKLHSTLYSGSSGKPLEMCFAARLIKQPNC